MRIAAGTRLGPYEIVAPLGSGGMGEVYRARDTRLDRTVAIKVLPPTDSDVLERRFEREAKSLSGFSHPHICALYDVGRAEGEHYLVMEFVEGETLGAKLREGPLSIDRALRLGAEIADALAAAHGRGVVHRDLKPGNIMLTANGAKLLDFGLAKTDDPVAMPATSDGDSETTTISPLTGEGKILGTLHYLSPEQAEGTEADTRSDLFALGAVLYETITGRRAFAGNAPARVLASILSSEPPAMTSPHGAVPPALERLVRRCLAKDPDSRWQSARDVVLELRSIANDPDASEDTPTPKRHARERWAWIGAIALLAAALVFVITRRPESSAHDGPVRLSVPIPHGATAGLTRVSPDGRHLAYAMIDGGNWKLWVRPAGGASARPLPGTRGAAHPFWSPDGGSVGFFADGKLKKIDLEGGPPETLCDAPGEFRMGTWGRDGTILFSLLEAPGAEGIYRVAAAGGEASVIRLRDDVGEVFGAHPAFLPDGREFVFRCFRETDEFVDIGLCVGSIDSDRVRPIEGLPPGVSRAEYAVPGHLVYARNDTLFAHAVDLDARRAEGDPFVLAQRVDHAGPIGLASFSVSETGVLTYQVERTPARLVWKDRSGRTIDALDSPGAYTGIRLSPDGSTLAITLVDASTQVGDIWTVDLARDLVTRFTTVGDQSDALLPVWSPDGDRIAYCEADEAPPFVHVKSRTDTDGTALLPSTGTLQCPSDWSADGKFLLFLDRHPTRGYDIWVLPLEGDDREARPLLATEFDEAYPTFSPDGRWIAYASDESGRQEVYIRPFDRPGERRRVSTDGGSIPTWRGDELFYLDDGSYLVAVTVGRGEDLEPGPPQRLFPTRQRRSLLREYDVGPDGERFLVADSDDGPTPPPTVLVNWNASRPR